MPKNGTDDTKRAQLDCALQYLRPDMDKSLRWASRRAVVRMAIQARENRKSDSVASRSDLAKGLQGVFGNADALLKGLQSPGVSTALFSGGLTHSFYSVNGPAGQEQQNLGNIEATDLDKLSDELIRALESLDAIKNAANAALLSLRIKGQRGNVTPWHRFRQPAKIIFAAQGALLFQVVNQLKSRPDHRNGRLSDFLTYAWQAATGEITHEWSEAIRATGRGAVPVDTQLAYLLGVLVA